MEGNDHLTGRRTRGGIKKAAAMAGGSDASKGAFKPGTRAFGQRAAARRERLQQSARRGDLRVQTAYKTVKASTAEKRKIGEGD